MGVEDREKSKSRQLGEVGTDRDVKSLFIFKVMGRLQPVDRSEGHWEGLSLDAVHGRD